MPRGALITGKTEDIPGWVGVLAILWPHYNIFPCIVLGPAHGQIGNAAGLFHVLKTAADVLHNLALFIQISGAPCGLAEGVIQVQCPWGTHRLRNRASTGQAQGGNPCRLESACDQSNGLMTDGSDRNQQGKVDFVFLQFGDHRRC